MRVGSPEQQLEYTRIQMRDPVASPTRYWAQFAILTESPMAAVACCPAGESMNESAHGSSAQLGARDDFAALRLWIAALHWRGVYVAQRRLRDESVRALSRAEGVQAVIVVDTSDAAHARIFSALHEYCHVVLRSTGICDLDEHRDVERYCNAVAAAVLLQRLLLDEELASVAFGVLPEASSTTRQGSWPTKGTPRKAPAKLVEGSVIQGWKAALGELALVYPDRINAYL